MNVTFNLLEFRDLVRRFGNVKVTGEIDEATQKLMKARRCGLADKPDLRFERSRHKRFTIHGQHWPYKNLTWREGSRTREIQDFSFVELLGI
ncbi:hypothetical protein KQX54_010064 [Cotesia glomerata]|uniref:Uncharacterized protein n=1 Tax=Cotesia glomerata TaxID=32391 RepID=A0AAV7IGZ5_COTGL|nr:hypothetical protein KQX54_010064 [Cotesia glomerata]